MILFLIFFFLWFFSFSNYFFPFSFLLLPSKYFIKKEQENVKETARRQQAFIQKSSYFPEICMMEGTTQVIARNCTKCYGRGHTRDRCLTVSI